MTARGRGFTPPGMVWYGMVDACDGYLAAEASGSSYKAGPTISFYLVFFA